MHIPTPMKCKVNQFCFHDITEKSNKSGKRNEINRIKDKIKGKRDIKIKKKLSLMISQYHQFLGIGGHGSVRELQNENKNK